ncbi:helicase C-terminal domain-containing protein [Pengzhenrongella sicca]|uniref:Helicase C-terminal domain-containing protein n=1 Tax=Pengzhenrongella sicca TaxID=2819238 RepID=A0A8A4ZC38_9MICO|nr:helicase C-terminal domain-containing protein [Pengzhenrongella sicca]QTE29560.1 helicase C-terminal domain-containing protein [Pengzhenrongella sicca]
MTPRDDLRRWLAGRSTHELQQTLTLRPDVLWGAPIRDLDDLADRLVHGISVSAVVGDLPAPAVQALEVLCALGAGATTDRVAALCDAGASGRNEAAHREHVERSLRVLAEGALAWPRPDGSLVLNPGVHEVIPYPLGFGRPAEVVLADIPVADLKRVLKRWGVAQPGRRSELVEAVRTYLADGSRVRMLLGDAPTSVARVLVDRSRETAQRALAARADPGGDDVSYGTLDYLDDPMAYSAHQSAVAWARENGLGFSPYSSYSGHVELPSEAILALVGADFRAPFTPVPPAVASAPVSLEHVRSSSAGAITDFLATAMATLEAIGRSPLAGLKSGGVGARELGKLAKRLGASPAHVRLTLELALWLRLLHRDVAGGLGTGPVFGEWRRRSPAERAADLLTVWFGLDYVPTTDRDADGRSLPALGRLGGPDQARAVRVLTFTHLAQLDDGVGVTAIETLADKIAWRLPIMMADGAALDLQSCWTEAQTLGMIAHGRLSDAGAAILADDRWGLVEALTVMLPGVETSALFGSDLTVVVPGSPDPAVVDLLDAVAVREGRGAASTWRVTPESLRAALDDGFQADDLVRRLRRLADGELPQALTYLIADVGRRHGHAQVWPAGAVVQSDDDALLAEIVVHRALRRLGLHRIAPTVLLAAAGPAEVIAGLRAAGYLPLELTGDGERVIQLRSPAPEPVGERAVEEWPGQPSERAAATGAELGSTGNGADLGGAAEPGRDGGPSSGLAAGLDQFEFDALGAGFSDEDPDDVLRQWIVEFATEGIGGAIDDGTIGGGAIDDGAARFGGSLGDPGAGPGQETAAQVAERLTGGVLPPQAERASVLERRIELAAPRLSADEVRQLAHAVAHGEPVKIVYRSSSGGLTVRIVSSLSLEPGHLVGWCHLRQDERTFALTSIQAVTPAPPPG